MVVMKKYLLFAFISINVLNASAQTAKVSSADSLKLELAKKQLTTFFSALHAIKADNIFNGGPITIFAPDDQAFAKLSAGMLDSLLKPASEITLANQVAFLSAHIIPGKLSSKDMAKLIHENNGQTVFTTLDSVKLTAKINANRNIVLTDERGNEFIVKQFDIPDGNAMIFIISSVIPPKKMDFKIILR
jgi:uncharacterized surface protein with fasciclin (FAS1) repeats